jgi:glycosyltransferase involved in cell wall biosynthesis
MKVSFIIPVYNAAPYLEQCVDSIIKQSYNDLEIILVDDGSTDGSSVICDNFAKKDNRIKVLHKSNGGQSDARNKGVSIATGEYIIFVDSDDFWIGEDSLQKIMEVVNANLECDFVSFNCSYYYPESNTYKKWVKYSEDLAVPLDKNSVVLSLVKSGTFPMSPCLKIISRKSINNMGLHFKIGTLAEDISWFIDLLDGSNKCMFVNMYIYAYRQNVPGSVTQSNSERVYNDLFNILKDELNKLEKRNFDKENQYAIYSFIAYEYCILLSILPNMQNPSLRRKELRNYKWLLNYTLNPKVKKASYIYRFLGLRMTEFALRIYNKKRSSRH